LSIEACTQAFAARPTDAALALRIAHAHHARARLPAASEWATRALVLDPSLAEAFVIVAHAEAHVGHSDAAVEAYRHYLALAPRGWHAAEARAAVRADAREKHASRDNLSSQG
jgi:predicted TPR repeat methyltransferase